MTEEQARAAIAADVSRETLERLSLYAAFLVKWQKKINLIAPSTIPAIWSRHLLDSAQLMKHAPADAQRWLDLGSGAGFPGLVCAAIAHESRPLLQVSLVESDQRKAAFLREAARQMGLSVVVHGLRVADVPPHSADVISARALAALTDLCDMAHPHLAPNGICLFQKGARHADEVEVAQSKWHIAYEIIPSVTDPDAVVMRIERLRHV